jgi:AAA+ ATPase superfamily predicted ATPase
MKNIIGRKQEIQELNDLYNSNKAQMVAIYGRRRVGKTFLVDEALKGRITFRHAGLSPNNEISGKKNLLKDQLKHFYNSLLLHGMKKSKQPASWLDAFFMLEQHLSDIDDGNRQVVFLDELPWLDTPRSGFLTAFEAFWNTWGCHRDNLMVVVCGSANSWILDNLINDTGGLYGRTTYEIKLSPFTLKETEEFLHSNDIKMSRYDIAQCNMILGGIPYYLGYLTKNNSLAQNIDQLFFSQKPKLYNEFNRLFASVFKNPEVMKKIIKLLATRHSGFTRKEIISKLDLGEGGDVTGFLNALIASDFIVKYTPFGKSTREDHYRLIDPFCLFYVRYISNKNVVDTNFWTNNQMSQSVVSWRGIAFEDLCLRHIFQIKRALGISGVITSQSNWIVPSNDNEPGMQIDLLINRNDNVVNMCEMKFYNEDFAVSGDYYKKIASRANKLHEELPKKYIVHSTLITTYGLSYNEYSGAFQQVITLEDFFS